MVSTIYTEDALGNGKFVAGEIFFRVVEAQILMRKYAKWTKQILQDERIGTK